MTQEKPSVTSTACVVGRRENPAWLIYAAADAVSLTFELLTLN